MADISQIQVSDTIYDIKDSTARDEISELPHSTSGTVGGWDVYENGLISQAQPYRGYINSSNVEISLEDTDNSRNVIINPDGISGTGTLYITKSVEISNNVQVTGDSLYTKALDASGPATFEADVQIGGLLEVYDITTLDSALYVNGKTFNSDNIYLANNKALYGTDTTGAYNLIAGFNSSNETLLGNNLYPTQIRGESLYCGAATTIANSLEVNDTATFSKSTSASGTSSNSPALIVGGTSTTAHLELDANSIMAKSSGTGMTRLNLNEDGGWVYARNFCIPEIQTGYLTMEPTAETVVSETITFDQTFSGKPYIWLSTESTLPQQVSLSYSSASTTGFTINLYRTNSITTGVRWLAIYYYKG